MEAVAKINSHLLRLRHALSLHVCVHTSDMSSLIAFDLTIQVSTLNAFVIKSEQASVARKVFVVVKGEEGRAHWIIYLLEESDNASSKFVSSALKLWR